MQQNGRFFVYKVNLTEAQHDTLISFAYDHLITQGGFSAALRAVIDEWYLMRQALRSLPVEVRLKHLPEGIPNIDLVVTQEDLAMETWEGVAKLYSK